MNGFPADRVVHALMHTEDLVDASLPDWELLVRQGRHADLLARIDARLVALGLAARVPPQPRAHLEAARRLVAAQQDEVRREIGHLHDAIEPLGLPLVLLKGAAYLAAGLSPSSGRVFSDTDILVPKGRIAEVESALVRQGWTAGHHTAYDQRYYRDWMHELPPMEHQRRGTVVDVHHAILPDTARLRPDPVRLLAAAVPVDGMPGVRVLAPADLVLHSMTHLLHNEDLTHGLRDLSDIDLLLREFSARPGFWMGLVARAEELGLVRPLHYGLRWSERVLGTPVPRDVRNEVDRYGPNPALRPLMDLLWSRALRTTHATAARPFTPSALFILYLRAHWLRMPPLLLSRHLAIKAWRRWRPEPVAT